jgi:hypothetical protein
MRESRRDAAAKDVGGQPHRQSWIPAFAGMTAYVIPAHVGIQL